MESSTAVRALAALAQPLRLQIFRALVVAGPQGLTPGAMSEGAGVPPNTLSFHLKELTHAGLVTQQREGRFLIYRADFAQMNGLLAYLTENCCQGQACLGERAGDRSTTTAAARR
jgi:ArsR family transcriptional regulator, arsenate/arsenite/antimonite-responsive transcriptional repressor